MTRIKWFLEQWGIHALLLPLFFLIHTYQQYYGLVSAIVTMRIGIIIIVLLALLFFLLLVLTKHVNKSLQLVTISGFFLLFFGAMKDFLHFSLHAGFISKYQVLLPLMILSFIFLSRLIVTKKDFRKTNLFQNLLLFLFLFIDVAKLIAFDHSAFLHNNLLTRNKLPIQTSSQSPVQRPNVYYLVFDSYPGNSFLREFMNYDNSLFNQMLSEKGFFVVKKPRSNYNRTAFSIASTLNFDYLIKIRKNDAVSPKEYAQANLTTKEAIVPQVFKHYNYSLYNLSVFDIDTTPAIRKETFLTMPEQSILLYNTLPERLKNDLLWHLITGKYATAFVQKFFTKAKAVFQQEQVQKKIFNKIVVDSLLKIPFQNTTSSKFVYAHLYLPHPPFFYDENGKENDIDYILTEASLKNKGLFLSYLRYTNKIIIDIINTINEASNNQSVIIVQSDHGFRDFTGGPNHSESYFANYTAFYFPDKNYSTLYDTLSNINTFPVIFNKYFTSNIPLQKDSSVFLPY